MGSGIKGVGSGIRRMGSEITALGSGIIDHGIGISSFLGIRDQAVPYLCRDQGRKLVTFWDQGSEGWDLGSQPWDQGSQTMGSGSAVFFRDRG